MGDSVPTKTVLFDAEDNMDDFNESEKRARMNKARLFREKLAQWLLGSAEPSEPEEAEEEEGEESSDGKDYFGSQTFFQDFLEGVADDLGEEFIVDNDDWSVEFFNNEKGKYIMRFYATVNSTDDEEMSYDPEQVAKEFEIVTGNLRVLDPHEEQQRQREIRQRKEGE